MGLPGYFAIRGIHQQNGRTIIFRSTTFSLHHFVTWVQLKPRCLIPWRNDASITQLPSSWR
jgi:hypothetical protein